MNGHGPLLRVRFKEHFYQMDTFQRQEKDDLEKLQMALFYIKEQNHIKAQELDMIEQNIKNKIDDKSTAIGEKYKVHL
jgi:hypothetical protein